MHATAVIFPEVRDALRALARHFRMGVVANADHDYLIRCLDHNSLRFELLVDSETAGCYKPDPWIFQRACNALSGPVGEAVMVGDTGWLLNERHGAPELRKDATDAGTIEGQRHVAWGSVGVVLAIRIGTRF